MEGNKFEDDDFAVYWSTRENFFHAKMLCFTAWKCCRGWLQIPFFGVAVGQASHKGLVPIGPAVEYYTQERQSARSHRPACKP